MLRIKCGNCDATIKVPQSKAGSKIACPKCDANMIVPFDTPNIDAIKQQAKERTNANEPAVKTDVLPAKIDEQHAELCQRQRPEKLTPGECFKRGFYGGFGQWCSFMALNIAFAVLAVLAMVMLGVIGAGAVAVGG